MAETAIFVDGIDVFQMGMDLLPIDMGCVSMLPREALKSGAGTMPRPIHKGLEGWLVAQPGRMMAIR